MRARTAAVPAVLTLVSLAVIAPLRATTIAPLNLEEMTARAATIFSGTCTAVEVVEDEALGAPVAVATFRVDRSV